METSALCAISSPPDGHPHVSACMLAAMGSSLPPSQGDPSGLWTAMIRIHRVLLVSLCTRLLGSLPSDSLFIFQGRNTFSKSLAISEKGFAFWLLFAEQDLPTAYFFGRV